MLGEIGVGQIPKTRPKNKLILNLKKLLNPKLAQEKITVIEDSSSQEELEEDEGLDAKEMEGKKQITLKDKSALTETKISKLLKEVRKKVALDHHQDDLMKQHSVMTTFCAEEEQIAEPLAQCSFEVNESPRVPVTMTEKQEEDKEIFKKLKIPWMPEGMPSTSKRQCIDSNNENLQRSIKHYEYQIEFLHETNEAFSSIQQKIKRGFRRS